MNSMPDDATAESASAPETEADPSVAPGASEPEASEGDAAAPEASEGDAAAPEASVPDERLIQARDLARAALAEITPERTIGDAAGYRVEQGGVVSLLFNNRLGGYPGWFWTVSVARVEGEEPTVLEAELLPGDGALVAPEWVPWAERLADYQAQQRVQAELAQQSDEDHSDDEDGDDEDGDDVDDLDDLDAADFDTDGSRILHAGDVDGVDIDELDSDEDDSDE